MCFFLLAGVSSAQDWYSIAGFDPSEAGFTYKLTSLGDSLIALGGKLTPNDGIWEPYSIAATISENSVVSLTPFVDWGGAFAALTFQDQLYIGGNFQDMDENPELRDLVKEVDGSFESIGVKGSAVYDMEEYQGALYIAGHFNEINGTELEAETKIIRFDGESSEIIGSPIGSYLYDLEVYQDKLYMVGNISAYTPDMDFDNPLWCHHIVWYDGEQWGTASGGVNTVVNSAVRDTISDLLYIGGSFTLADSGNVEVNRVAIWDGENWHAVGNELQGQVKTLCFYRGQLYAGGYDLLMNTHDLVYWDGYHWQPVVGSDQILDGQVRTLVVHDDHLFAGGSFDLIGSFSTQGIAKYYLEPENVVWGIPDGQVEHEDQFYQIECHPTPTNHFCSLTVPFNAIGKSYVLNSLSGQQIASGQIPDNLQLNFTQIQPGMYVLTIEGIGKCRVIKE